MKAFRELLVKKAQELGDLKLEVLVKSQLCEAFLQSMVVDSLRKMAYHDELKTKNTNPELYDFLTDQDPDVLKATMHDAMSHHASHYVNSLKNMNPERADAHAKKLLTYIDMARRLDSQKNVLNVNSVPVHPLEATLYNTLGQLWDQKLQAARMQKQFAPLPPDMPDPDENPDFYKPKMLQDSKKGKKEWHHSQEPKGESFAHNRNSGFAQALNSTPDPTYALEIKKHGHSTNWPVNHTSVDGAYLDINPEKAQQELIQSKGQMVEHPFDSHPILEHYNKPKKNEEVSPEYKRKLHDYRNVEYNTPEGPASKENQVGMKIIDKLEDENWKSKHGTPSEVMHHLPQPAPLDVEEALSTHPKFVGENRIENAPRVITGLAEPSVVMDKKKADANTEEVQNKIKDLLASIQNRRSNASLTGTPPSTTPSGTAPQASSAPNKSFVVKKPTPTEIPAVPKEPEKTPVPQSAPSTEGPRVYIPKPKASGQATLEDIIRRAKEGKQNG